MKKITEVVGALGFLLALISLIWQINVYHSDSINVSSSGPISNAENGDYILHISITNTGRHPIYLRRITIKHDHGSGKYSTLGGFIDADSDKPLQPGQELNIPLKNWGEWSLPMMPKLDRLKSYLVVETTRGEVVEHEIREPKR